MIEQLLSKLPNHGRAASRFAWKYLRHVPPTWAMVALALSTVGGRALHLSLNRPAQREQIAASFGAVGLFYGAPSPSPSGDQFTYVRQSDQGIGVYLADTQGSKPRLIYDHTGDRSGFDMKVWPWAPDTSAFSYSLPGKLVIYPTEPGLPPADIPAPTTRDLVWLSPKAFVHMANKGEITAYHKNGNDVATGLALWAGSPVANASGAFSLIAVDARTIAFGQSNRVYTINLAEQPATPRLLLDAAQFAPAGQLLSRVSYAPQTGGWLLTCSSSKQSSLWTCYTGADARDRKPPALVSGPEPVSAGAWLAGKDGGFAYLSPKAGQNVLVVQDSAFSRQTRLFTMGTAESFTSDPASSDKLFVIGIATNEPSSGLYLCEPLRESLQLLVPCSDSQSTAARSVDPSTGTFTLSSGRKVTFHLYRPADFDRRDRHKQYPLLIGSTVFGTTDMLYQRRAKGPLWAPALAACGAYVVIVERRSWTKDIDQWEENITATCQELFKNPTIDRDRLFVFGASAETSHLSKLVETSPQMWRGVILLNPGALPNIDTLKTARRSPRMLISMGELENRQESIRRYQESGLRAGVPIDYIVHSGETHWLQARSSVLERTRAMMRFINED